MSVGKAISLFLIDDLPDGRVACELFNWTGKGYRIPRRLFRESADRTELRKAGIYFLFGRDEARIEANSVYVGEAEEVYKRVSQQQDKDFWTEVLLFISKDENLNKAHVKFLEFTAYSAAEAAARFELTNSNVPNKPAISEVEQAVMMEFFDNLKLLTGALGYKLFEPLAAPPGTAEDEYFISAARGANARAVLTNDGIVVRAGSEAAATVAPSTPESIVRQRDSLVQDGILRAEESKLVFTRDHLFASPSSAAAVVLGRSANGRIEWRDLQGRTIKDNEE